jgi:hypothetical protein
VAGIGEGSHDAVVSQVTSMAEFPVPSVIQRAFHKSMEALGGKEQSTPAPTQEAIRWTGEGSRCPLPLRPVTPSGLKENIYATLPKSLKAELLVSSCVEDPELAAERRELTKSKSVSELSQIRSIADFPIPENLERLMSRAGTNPAEPTDRSVQDRTVARLAAAESRLAEVEKRLIKLERCYAGRAVRFHQGK